MFFIATTGLGQKKVKSTTPSVYYPGKAWEKRQPEDVGMDAGLLKEAVGFAIANEASAPRDLKLNHYRSFGREPFGYAIGP
ncbi:MAG TPA: serine hydrolase, partial [Cyclobacteriaceae bacterium]|nr:serine hydrolase [Cyclobacteriaceae bacterium]